MDEIEENVKTQVKHHMIREYYDELLSDGIETEYCRIFGEKTCVKWMAGMKAAYNVKPF